MCSNLYVNKYVFKPHSLVKIQFDRKIKGTDVNNLEFSFVTYTNLFLSLKPKNLGIRHQNPYDPRIPNGQIEGNRAGVGL